MVWIFLALKELHIIAQGQEPHLGENRSPNPYIRSVEAN
jgi:hypothetical protein